MSLLDFVVPVSLYRGHLNSTFYVRSALSPDDRFLISGSSDYHAYIWNVSELLCLLAKMVARGDSALPSSLIGLAQRVWFVQ